MNDMQPGDQLRFGESGATVPSFTEKTFTIPEDPSLTGRPYSLVIDLTCADFDDGRMLQQVQAGKLLRKRRREEVIHDDATDGAPSGADTSAAEGVQKKRQRPKQVSEEGAAEARAKLAKVGTETGV